MRMPLFLFGLILSAGTCMAQTTPQPPPTAAPPATQPPTRNTAIPETPRVDPEKEANIRRRFEVIGLEASIKQTLGQTSEQQKSILIGSLPPGDYREKFVTLLLERVTAKLTPDILVTLAIPIYEKYFTNEEIKGMTEFYQTPLGRKMLTASPQVMAEVMQTLRGIGQLFVLPAMAEVFTEHPELKAGHDAAYAAARARAGGVAGIATGGEASGAPPPPPPAPDVPPLAPKRIRVATGVQQAKLINQVQPEYPPLARQARVEGTVKLHAIVGRDGTITQLEVLAGPPLLIPAAVDAVKQWRYKPTLLLGEPVEVETHIDVNFQLGPKPPAQP